MIDNYPIGTVLVCPVCMNRFELKEEHKFIVKDHYTCSWKCFLNYKSSLNTEFSTPLVEVISGDNKKLSYYQRHKEELAEKRKAGKNSTR